ncbi:hypothetical protein LJK88_44635 [Paenibacillus sp. P26]|nr:hypothetical protein LJK88_44635 [Paenibacillus sp. P26]
MPAGSADACADGKRGQSDEQDADPGRAVLTMDAARSVYFPGYVLYEDGRILEAGEWPADGARTSRSPVARM